MPASPPNVTIRPFDSPKPIWFTAWTYNPPVGINISISTTFFGMPPVVLDLWPVWKFKNVARHASGGGVVGELYFDHALAQTLPECTLVYNLLWPNRAVLNAVCTYSSPIAEPVTIQLEP